MAERKKKTKKETRPTKTTAKPKRSKSAAVKEDKSQAKTPESVTPAVDGSADTAQNRLDRIKESHELLEKFSQDEIKTLLNLKRNTSPKAWTLREDLIVLSVSLSNREIADILKGRNKEAVKKRLQLLRSKGLKKRTPEPPPAKEKSAG